MTEYTSFRYFIGHGASHNQEYFANFALTTTLFMIRKHQLIIWIVLLCNVSHAVAQSSADTVRGLNLGPVAAHVRGELTGIQASIIVNDAREVKGVQLAGLGNLCLTPLYGVQISPLNNLSRGVRKGVQLGGLNITSGDMRGVQGGVYNYADTLCGVQIGLVNVNDRNPRGFQFGFINLSNDLSGVRLGLLNVGPATTTDLLVFGGNSTAGNIAWRFRNRSAYSIIGTGFYYADFDRRFSGSVFYRMGRYFPLSPRLTVSADIGYAHIETFEEKSSDRPQRLFSLQGRLSIDYQFGRHVGAFVTGGYGHTRWYAHHARFRNKPVLEAGMTFRLTPAHDEQPGFSHRMRTLEEETLALAGDSAEAVRQQLFACHAPGAGRRRPWRAVAEVAGINLLVNSADRFMLHYDYAKTSAATVWRNMKNGFVWDNDYFSTNQFAHPYHGNLYFNAARTSGLGFLASFPYALGGSLMWELAGETDPPALNDIVSTSIGGAAIGEVFYRTSSLLLDDRDRGFSRFLRELGAGILNPVRAFNRIVTGQAWRIRSDHALYHDFMRLPVDLSLSFGVRYLADGGAMTRGEYSPFLNVHLEYGDAFNETNVRPYDFFTADLSLMLGGSQPFVSGIHLMGRLCSRQIRNGNHVKMQAGIFQHFDYYASEKITHGSGNIPYKISETAAFGPGLIYRINGIGSLKRLEQRIFLNGILLGGVKSDYYSVLDRDYNIGSGYGMKSSTLMQFHRFGKFSFHAAFYHLWTWKGYEERDLAGVDPHFYNVQGDHSHARLIVISPNYRLRLRHGWELSVSGASYSRVTTYHSHDQVYLHTYEILLGMAYRF